MESREYTVTVERTSSHRAAQARAYRKARAERLRKRVCGAIAFISFFLLLGIVGGVEHDSIALGSGTLYMALTLGAGALFTWLAGGFDDEKTG